MKKKGVIYVGYQGIGKSTIAGTSNCIDLESGNFWVDGERQDNWYEIYCNIATHLMEQGYNVFVSSHKVVRDEFAKRKIPYITIAPSLKLKEVWLQKLKERYDETKLDKDYKALKNAEEKYDENVLELLNDDNAITCIKIKNKDYYLPTYVNAIGLLRKFYDLKKF